MNNNNECCESVQLKFKSPLVEIIKDETVIHEFVSRIKAIPKFQADSWSSLAFLEFIKSQCSENPTLSVSKIGINNFAFGGSIDIKLSETPNLKSRGKAIDAGDFDAFDTAVNSIGLSLVQLADATKVMNDSLIDSGDGYLYLSLEKIGTSWVTNIEGIQFTDFMYWSEKRKAGIPQYGIWCKNWTDKTIVDGVFKLLNVTQGSASTINWSVSKKNTLYETIIHYKNGSGRLYGNFGLSSVFRQILTENQETEKLLKISDSAMVGLGALFLPMPPQNKTLLDAKGKPISNDGGIKGIAQALDRKATNRGDSPSELLVSNYYPQDGKPEYVNFGIHRDTAWTVGIDTLTTSKIYQYLQWSKTIGGGEQTRGGLGSNTEMNELLKVNAINILPTQNNWEMRFSSIFNGISELTGIDIFKKVTIKFERKIDELISQYKELNLKNGTTGSNNTGL